MEGGWLVFVTIFFFKCICLVFHDENGQNKCMSYVLCLFIKKHCSLHRFKLFQFNINFSVPSIFFIMVPGLSF